MPTPTQPSETIGCLKVHTQHIYEKRQLAKD